MPWAEIVFLGTGGAVPTRERLTSCIAVQDWNGAKLLLDAGEACQLRLAEAGLSPSQVDAVLVTHIHGDHVNGLPGLLQSMAVNKRRKPLTVAGPRSVVRFVSETLEASSDRLGFPLKLVDVESEKSLTVYERGGDTLRAAWFRTCHTRDSHGYTLEWRLRPRILVPPGLSPREAASLARAILGGEEGTTARIVYTGDTAPCTTVLEAARGALVLIHEATFDSSREREALERLHSTASHAAIIAAEAGARLLVLTHISARYRGYEARVLLEEAASLFPRTVLAHDMMRIRVRLPIRAVPLLRRQGGP